MGGAGKQSCVFVVVGVALAGALSGCLGGGVGYPQYTGVYTLESARFLGGAAPADVPPQRVKVTHRLFYRGNDFESRLRVEPIADVGNTKPASKVSSGFVLPLDDLTRRLPYNIEDPQMDGIVLKSAAAASGASTYCSLRYRWAVSSDARTGISPSLDEMRSIYQSHVQERVGSKVLDVQLAPKDLLDPPMDTSAVKNWNGTLAREGGARLEFTLSMAALGAVYGCDLEEGLPGVSGPIGQVILTYRALTGDLNSWENPVAQSLPEFSAGFDTGLKFWSELVESQ